MSRTIKTKEFRDPVHGYISVPDNFCKYLIDTDVFQRLRHIEQTSMRALYPSAHHERFTHSLGTYHLGSLAFHHFQKNSEKLLKDINQNKWDKYKFTFLIACLMHDCAHAPFSHTFEHYYRRSNLIEQISKKTIDKNFQNDLENGQCSPKDHEAASALLVLNRFQKEIKRLNGDPILAVRMILGNIHVPADTIEKQVENCLIELLNGQAIDVDKLDYIVRDTWASGVNNVSIDVHRLLSSLGIAYLTDLDKYVLSFNKSALSVVRSVVEGKNFLYQWIYNHHTVVYDQYLLKKSIEALAKIICPENPEDFLIKFFSLDSLEHPIKIGNHTFFLPSDGDLIFLLKSFSYEIPEALEWLSRKYTRRSLWKTYAEFKFYLPGINKFKMDRLRVVAEDILNKDLSIMDTNVIVLDANTEFAAILKNELYINFNGHARSYDSIFEEEKKPPQKMFYVYIPDNSRIKTKNVIAKLKNSVK